MPCNRTRNRTQKLVLYRSCNRTRTRTRTLFSFLNRTRTRTRTLLCFFDRTRTRTRTLFTFFDRTRSRTRTRTQNRTPRYRTTAPKTAPAPKGMGKTTICLFCGKNFKAPRFDTDLVT